MSQTFLLVLINPRTDGGLGQLRTDGGGGADDSPPEISKTKQRSEKRQTAFETLGEGLPKVLSHVCTLKVT